MDEYAYPVLNRKECQRAVPVIQNEYTNVLNSVSKNKTSVDNPEGCMLTCLNEECRKKEMHWNSHHPGKRHNQTMQICKKSKIIFKQNLFNEINA